MATERTDKRGKQSPWLIVVIISIAILLLLLVVFAQINTSSPDDSTMPESPDITSSQQQPVVSGAPRKVGTYENISELSNFVPSPEETVTLFEKTTTRTYGTIEKIILKGRAYTIKTYDGKELSIQTTEDTILGDAWYKVSPDSSVMMTYKPASSVMIDKLVAGDMVQISYTPTTAQTISLEEFIVL